MAKLLDWLKNIVRLLQTNNTTREKQLPNTGETNNTGFFASIIALIGGWYNTYRFQKKEKLKSFN